MILKSTFETLFKRANTVKRRPLKLLGIILFWAQVSWAQPELPQRYVPPPVNPDQVVLLNQSMRPPPIAFIGNIAIADAALLSAIGLRFQEKPAEGDIPEIARRINEFYRRAGYDLVRVEVQTTGSGWAFYIDEGVINEIQIFGLGWYDTFVLRKSLLLQGIFNRMRIEKQLGEWAQRPYVDSMSYEIVRTRRLEDLSSNEFIKEIGRLMQTKDDTAALRNRWGIILKIYCNRKEQTGDFDFGTGYSSNNGFEVDLNYDHGALFAESDNLRFSILGGVNSLATLDPVNNSDYLFVNAYSTLTWVSPPLADPRMRAYIESKADVVNRQRPDLPLDRFQLLKVRESANLAYEFARNQKIHVGFGYEYQNLFDFNPIIASPFVVTTAVTQALFVNIGADFLFGRPKARRQMNHTASLNYNRRFRDNGDALDLIQLRYRRSFELPALDFKTLTSGTALLGKAQFYDEFPLESLGFRTNFDFQFSIKKAATLRTDLLLNVYERKIQVGPFQDFGLFGRIDRTSGGEDLTFAYDVGPTIQLLVLDAFQAYSSLAFGFTSNGEQSSDIRVGIEKIF